MRILLPINFVPKLFGTLVLHFINILSIILYKYSHRVMFYIIFNYIMYIKGNITFICPKIEKISIDVFESFQRNYINLVKIKTLKISP